jgi:hypothetical protein
LEKDLSIFELLDTEDALLDKVELDELIVELELVVLVVQYEKEEAEEVEFEGEEGKGEILFEW